MAGYRWRDRPFTAEHSTAPKPRLGIAPANKKTLIFNPALCGSKEGWWQHRRLKTTFCDDCAEGYNEYQRDYRAKQKAAKVAA